MRQGEYYGDYRRQPHRTMLNTSHSTRRSRSNRLFNWRSIVQPGGPRTRYLDLEYGANGPRKHAEFETPIRSEF